MQVAKVIGNIWATRKEEKLAGLKLLLVQPINPLTGELYRIPIVAADIIGAGVGGTAPEVGGSAARSAAGEDENPGGRHRGGHCGRPGRGRQRFAAGLSPRTGGRALPRPTRK